MWFSSETQYPSDYGTQLQDGENFDFIIVGAGSAGSLVANRLSENAKWKVLLIEAGTYPSVDSEIPSLAPNLQTTDENWQYRCEPSDYLRWKESPFCPRGKGLGGSSLINYLLYLRGNRYDFDKWAQAGNVGWNFDSILRHFEKIENVQGEDNNRFGKNGELRIRKAYQSHPIMPDLIHAYRELGYNNYNEENPVGTTYGYFTIFNGKRYHSAKAFLGENTKDRANLFIALNAQVSKLLVDSHLTVKGVEVRLNKKLLKVYAKEVILSAGAVNSPQILMNSGIGPKSHLENLGIEVLKNLHVGENLQDHVLFLGLNFKLHKSALNPIHDKSSLDAAYQYFMHGEGPLSVIGSQFFAFVDPKNNSKFPSIQIYHNLKPQTFTKVPASDVVKRGYQLPKNLTDTIIDVNAKNHIAEIVLSLAYPKSTGKIRLRSNDPFDPPLIFTNYLSNNQDVINIIEGIRFVQNWVKTKSLQHYKPEYVTYNFSNCEEFNYDSYEYWDCLIRHLVRTNFHLVGSCKMGPESDPAAVVDSRLKVHGVKGLRVIDGSIMPSIVGGNVNGAIIMIGEKGSEMVKEDWIKTNKLN